MAENDAPRASPKASPAFTLVPGGAKPRRALMATGPGRAHDCATDHAPDDPHGHDQGHAHDHAHAHDQAPAHVMRPPRFEPAETGGAAIQFDSEALLPGERDERGRFGELTRAFARIPGVTATHLRSDSAGFSVCVHHDAPDAPALADQIQASAARVADRYRARTWMVRGMDAAQCGVVIEYALNRTEGVLTASVAYAAERLVLEYDSELVTERALERRVEALGYALEDPPAGHVCAFHGGGEGLAPRLAPWLVAGSGVAIAAGLALEHLAPEPIGSGPLASGPALVATGLYAAALCAAGFFPARTAFGSLRQLRADIETLTVVAAIGAGMLRAWFEGAFLLFLFSLGHSLEHRAMQRARQAVDALAQLRPDVARVQRGGSVVEVRADLVAVEEIALVRPGDRVALDGIIIEGASHLDEAAITGESVPRPKSVGDTVHAGTINQDGALSVRVTKRAGESTLARLVDMVASAEARKSPDQRLTTRLERIFVPIVLVAAPALAIGLVATGSPVKDAVLRGLALLVAASPCALAVATPSVVLSAVARAAQAGVLVKGGAELHALGRVRAIAFDKTGTLTLGKPRLLEIVGADEALLLATAAGAESQSAHPIAVAVLSGAAERGITPGAGSNLVAVHGKGIRAQVDGQAVSVGRADWLEGVPADILAAVARMEAEGKTTLVVQRGGQTLGALGVADTLRPEAAETLAALRAMGLDRTVLLSGDNLRVASAIANQVGITEAQAPLLPEDKVRAVRDLARHGGVAMVGDGVNDAPALASASIGISLGGAGSDVALQTADIVLMADGLGRLPFALGLARAANRAVKLNIAIALGVACVLVVASIMGEVGISQAVILHEGSTLLVVLNGLRLLRWRHDVRGELPVGGRSTPRA